MRILSTKWIVPFLWMAIITATANQFFFWDTVQLSSKHAHWFYENNFSYFFLPEEMNSGHPPLYGILLAICWKILGYRIWVGHLLNGIIIVGVIIQSHTLSKKFLEDQYRLLIPLVFFLNPIILGHSVLVSPDNLLLFSFLFIINSHLGNKKFFSAAGLALLAAISLRGMMLVVCFFIAELIFNFSIKKPNKLEIIYKYLPSGTLALIFLTSHYFYQNWIGFHEDSPWIQSFQAVEFKVYLYNIGLVIWRFLDFGNIALIAGLLLTLKSIKKLWLRHNYRYLFILLLVISISFTLILSAYSHLTAHRYFIPVYILISILFVLQLKESHLLKWLPIFLIILGSGHFWLYPRHISQGWDVSLTHLPIYHQTRKMINWMDNNNINRSEIGTEFPLKSEFKYLLLEDKEGFKEAELKEDRYILYSRIMNDFKEKEFKYISEHFRVIKKYNYYGIDLILYERT